MRKALFCFLLILLLACFFCVTAFAATTYWTEEELITYLQTCADRNDSSISFVVSKTLMSFLNQGERFQDVCSRAGLSWWDGSYYNDGTYKLTNVTYYDHYNYCENNQRLNDYLRFCTAMGWANFAFYLPAITSDDYQQIITPALRDAGIRNWSSTHCGRVYEITGVVYHKNYRQCSTLNEVKNYVRYCSERQLNEFAFTYPASAAGIMEQYFDLLYNYGYWEGTAYHVKESRLIYIDDITYRPGYNIVNALNNGTQYALTYAESQTLSIAKTIVSEAKQSCYTAFQYAKFFHDYLITHVTYQKAEEGAVNDTAVGALVYGIAECDGYSDAFYLLCSLADIDVSFQYGDTDRSDSDKSHLWNILKINGAWHFVDVTWDDKDWSTNHNLFTYRYFNVGYTYMTDHRFYAELSPVVVAPYMDWDYFIYTAGDAVGIENGVYTTDPGYFIKQWYKEGRRVIHLMVDGIMSDAEMTKYLEKAITIKGVRWNFYRSDFDKYSLIDLYIRPY